ncbi:hypothetical protein ACFQPF_03630 [Fictibacillus iocasae]|uniref:Uncharacterized protein n=1 Tax=Fictibacillus iocasae TaxID=2715437 RepID=A0ABW2NMB0_9BACL
MKEVPYFVFLRELKKELLYHHSEGSTSYRRDTAVLAVYAAISIGKIEPFKERSSSFQTISEFYPTESEEKVYDIAKMLHVIYKDIYNKQNVSNDLKQYLCEKRFYKKELGPNDKDK